MQPRGLVLVALLFACTARAEKDRLLHTICAKTISQLESIVTESAKRGITLNVPEFAEGEKGTLAYREKLAQVVYNAGQAEIAQRQNNIPGREAYEAHTWAGCKSIEMPEWYAAEKERRALLAKEAAAVGEQEGLKDEI